MALFALFLSQNYTHFPNGGRGGYFMRYFDDLTIMGAISMVLWPKVAVFVPKYSPNHTQNPNRGEGVHN